MTCMARWFTRAAAIMAMSFAAGGTLAAQDGLEVVVDQATVMKVPQSVATIVVGNPLIADVSLQPGGMLVVTGKGYGTTNVMALDRSGAVLLNTPVRVQGPDSNIVVVYRGPARETYSCQPKCEQRITLGDATTFFNSTIGQTVARNGGAQNSTATSAAAPR